MSIQKYQGLVLSLWKIYTLLSLLSSGAERFDGERSKQLPLWKSYHLSLVAPINPSVGYGLMNQATAESLLALRHWSKAQL
jgi:hypothetical protein